jgi:hypothetical protein
MAVEFNLVKDLIGQVSGKKWDSFWCLEVKPKDTRLNGVQPIEQQRISDIVHKGKKHDDLFS